MDLIARIIGTTPCPPFGLSVAPGVKPMTFVTVSSSLLAVADADGGAWRRALLTVTVTVMVPVAQLHFGRWPSLTGRVASTIAVRRAPITHRFFGLNLSFGFIF